MPSLQNYHAVFVDDNPANNFLTKTIIEIDELPIEASIFDNPHNALDFITDLLKGENTELPPIDVMFIDLQMPQLHGFDFIAKYEELQKEYDCKAPICIMTSNIVEEVKEKAATFPSVIGVYVKPFSPEIWEEVLKKYENDLKD